MSEVLHFSVEGEFITQHFRNLLKEGEWEKAINGFRDSMICHTPDGTRIKYPEDAAIRLLMGEEQLVGKDEEMELVDDDRKEVMEEQLKYLYRGLFYNRAENIFYKPYALVNTCIYEKEQEYFYDRAKIYSNNPQYDIVIKVKHEGFTYAVLCELTTKRPPSWMFDEYCQKTPQEAFEECLKHNDILETGIIFESNFRDIVEYQHLDWDDEHIELENDIRNEMAYDLNISSLRTKILKQAKEGYGFIEVELKDGRNYLVPKAPFLNWAIKFNYNSRKDHLLKWNVIANRGMKMRGDNPEHTDWVIGMGLNPEDYYGDETLEQHMSSLAFKIMKKTIAKEFITLAGTGSFKGKVQHVFSEGDFELVSEGDIVIIPNANIEFFEVALKVGSTGCVITEIGGPGAHLAVNAAEKGINLLLIPDAFTSIPEHSEIEINIEEGNINVL